MEFKRKKVKKSETRRWVSDCKHYCVTLRKYGYYATVLTEDAGCGPWWNFAYRRGPHKTLKKAIESCEKNRRLWDAFVKLSHSDGRRDGRLATLKAREPEVFWFLPAWVRAEAEPTLIEMLCRPSTQNQSDHTETSKSSGNDSSMSDSPTSQAGPAPSAAEKGKFATRKTAARSKGTSSRRGTPVATAEAPAEQSAKRSKRSTTPKSESGKKSSKPGGNETPSASKPSKSSRSKKRAA